MATDWSRLPDLIPRKHASSFLKDMGFSLSDGTLRHMAMGTYSSPGPPHYKFGNRILYKQTELRAWAEARTVRRER
jgi:hypothetical protein